MNIYLDIDGVLLTHDGKLACCAHEFLTYVTSHHPTYWLTTHCRGDIVNTHEFLKRSFPPETYAVAKQIIPTNWNTYKTEAIDFTQPFLWFDDVIFAGEKMKLSQQSVIENWIEVDLRKDENQLQKFLTHFPIPIELLTTK